MDLYKFGVKLFITNSSPKPLAEFIPVFQGWIQRQALPGHLLIDVHDYSHVPNGPGILLVSHQANLGIDENGGRRGLVYIRKQPGSLRDTVASAKAAAQLLTAAAGLTFDESSMEIFYNDRLEKPSPEQIREASGGQVTLKPQDPRERLTYTIKL